MTAPISLYKSFRAFENTTLTELEISNLVEWLIKLQQKVTQQQRLLEEQRWHIEEQNKRIEMLADEVDNLKHNPPQKTLFSSSLEPEKSEEFPSELIKFSVKAEIKKEQDGYQRASISYQEENNSATLMPLHDRDMKALGALFDSNDLDTIADNIDEILLFLLPEPCWEENSFEFLEEFL